MTMIKLSPTERVVLELMVQGKTNTQIALETGVSVYSVHKATDRIYNKLDCRRDGYLTRVLAIRWFLEEVAYR